VDEAHDLKVMRVRGLAEAVASGVPAIIISATLGPEVLGFLDGVGISPAKLHLEPAHAAPKKRFSFHNIQDLQTIEDDAPRALTVCSTVAETSMPKYFPTSFQAKRPFAAYYGELTQEARTAIEEGGDDVQATVGMVSSAITMPRVAVTVLGKCLSVFTHPLGRPAARRDLTPDELRQIAGRTAREADLPEGRIYSEHIGSTVVTDRADARSPWQNMRNPALAASRNSSFLDLVAEFGDPRLLEADIGRRTLCNMCAILSIPAWFVVDAQQVFCTFAAWAPASSGASSERFRTPYETRGLTPEEVTTLSDAYQAGLDPKNSGDDEMAFGSTTVDELLETPARGAAYALGLVAQSLTRICHNGRSFMGMAGVDKDTYTRVFIRDEDEDVAGKAALLDLLPPLPLALPPRWREGPGFPSPTETEADHRERPLTKIEHRPYQIQQETITQREERLRQRWEKLLQPAKRGFPMGASIAAILNLVNGLTLLLAEMGTPGGGSGEGTGDDSHMLAQAKMVGQTHIARMAAGLDVNTKKTVLAPAVDGAVSVLAEVYCIWQADKRRLVPLNLASTAGDLVTVGRQIRRAVAGCLPELKGFWGMSQMSDITSRIVQQVLGMSRELMQQVGTACQPVDARPHFGAPAVPQVGFDAGFEGPLIPLHDARSEDLPHGLPERLGRAVRGTANPVVAAIKRGDAQVSVRHLEAEEVGTCSGLVGCPAVTVAVDKPLNRMERELFGGGPHEFMPKQVLLPAIPMNQLHYGSALRPDASILWDAVLNQNMSLEDDDRQALYAALDVVDGGETRRCEEDRQRRTGRAPPTIEQIADALRTVPIRKGVVGQLLATQGAGPAAVRPETVIQGTQRQPCHCTSPCPPAWADADGERGVAASHGFRCVKAYHKWLAGQQLPLEPACKASGDPDSLERWLTMGGRRRLEFTLTKIHMSCQIHQLSSEQRNLVMRAVDYRTIRMTHSQDLHLTAAVGSHWGSWSEEVKSVLCSMVGLGAEEGRRTLLRKLGLPTQAGVARRAAKAVRGRGRGQGKGKGKVPLKGGQTARPKPKR
jgi:hypothetical protein